MSEKQTGPARGQVTIKISDEVQRGVYSNRVMIGHTQDEFILDFILEMPPGPQVVARVVTAPAHAAALLDALADNLSRYEKQHGRIRRPTIPPPPPGTPTN